MGNNNPIKKMLVEAAAADLRRQQQIHNQIEAINLLLAVNAAMSQFIAENNLTTKWETQREAMLEAQAADAKETAAPTGGSA